MKLSVYWCNSWTVFIWFHIFINLWEGKQSNCVVHLYAILLPFSHIIIILLPEILPFPLLEVTALSLISCCIVVGSGKQTGSVTTLGHCSTKSSVAMAWPAEVPRKITEIRHVVIAGFWPVRAAFYLKKRQGTCRDLSLLAILQTWRTQQLLKNDKRTTVPNNREKFSKQLTIIYYHLCPSLKCDEFSTQFYFSNVEGLASYLSRLTNETFAIRSRNW